MRGLSERDIQSTVEEGQRNKQAIELVGKWCRHIKLDRMPGRGMIEQWFNVPIGHFGFQCEHAPRGGSYMSSAEQSFLEFYDKNCHSCPHRIEVRKPNIQPSIDRHLKEKAETDKRANQAALEATIARDSRRTDRANMKLGASVLTVEALDLLDALDDGTDERAGDKLVEMARLAPDGFDHALVDFLILQCSQEVEPIASTAFAALALLDVAEATLLSLAINRLKADPHDEAAAEIVGRHAASLDENSMASVLPLIAQLALPGNDIFNRRSPKPIPLQRIVSAQPQAVRTNVEKYLDGGKSGAVKTACRILLVIAGDDQEFVRPFSRQLLSKLLRVSTLVPEFIERDEGGLNLLRQIGKLVLELDFPTGDKIIQSLLQGADEIAREEAARLYTEYLEDSWKDAKNTPTGDDETAFKRVLWTAVDDAGKNNLDSRAISYLSYVKRDHAPLLAKQVDTMLGAAAVLSQKLAEVDKPSPIERIETGLEAMERNNRRSAIYNLQGALIQCAILGVDGPEASDALLSLLDQIPENQVEMRANMVAHLADLVTTPESLKTVLPYFYSAMTDREVRIRASGVSAAGKVTFNLRRNYPDLMFELQIALLTDPYRMVHQAAVRELHTYDFPDHLKPALEESLRNLINSYVADKNNGRFLLDCLEHYVRGCATEEQLAGALGGKIVEIILDLDDYLVEGALTGRVGTSLRRAPGYAAALIKQMKRHWRHEYNHDPLLEALLSLTADELRSVAEDIQDLAISVSKDNPHRSIFLFGVLIKAGTWTTLVYTAKTIEVSLPDTVRDRPIKHMYRQLIAAFETELSLPPTLESISSARSQWLEAAPEKQSEIRNGYTDYYPIRFQVLEQLIISGAMSQPATTTFGDLCDEIERIAAKFQDEFPGHQLRVLSFILRIYSTLLGWAAAVRSAEQNAERFLKAAKIRVKEFMVDGSDLADAPAIAVFHQILALEEIDGLIDLRKKTLSLQCAFPIFPPQDRHVSFDPTQDRATEEPLNIAFLSFDIDGQGASSVNTVEPNKAYDMGLEVRVSRWPEKADRLVLTPFTVEPSSIYDLPSFVFERPKLPGTQVLKDTGRLVLKIPHSIAARPYEFKYGAIFEPNASEQAVSIVGHRTLRIESVDIKSNPVSGFADIDRKLLELRQKLRTMPGVPDEEISTVFDIAACLGNLAGTALADSMFAAKTLEQPFHEKCAEWLRRWPTIGEQLEQHPHTGRGITDLSFQRARIELKACPDSSPTPQEIEKFAEQTAQYTVSSGHRLGVLCVLDSTPKDKAPPPVASQMQIVTKRPGDAHVPVLIIIVQGGLSRPSDLSR